MGAPATPLSGVALLYPKADHRWYMKDDAGAERQVMSTSLTTDGVLASVRAGFNVSGGGTLSFSNGAVKWSQRFIVISGGRGPHFAVGGYYDINMPAAGIVIAGHGGLGSVTVTADGVPLGSWRALYYELPLGQNSGTLNGNYRIVDYSTSGDVVIPENWLLIAVRNNDNNAVKWCTGVVLLDGETWSAANRTQAHNHDSSYVGLTGNQTISGVKTFTSEIVGPASGNVLKVGDDARLVDVNVSHVMGIISQTDSNRGGIRLGGSFRLEGAGVYGTATGHLDVTGTLNSDGKLSQGGNGVFDYVQSRGEGLVTNGSGLLRNNYNFTNWTFDPTVSKVGGGSFRRDHIYSVITTDELIPVDPSKPYRVEFFIKGTNNNAALANRNYFGMGCYDIDGLFVESGYVMATPGTETTLAAPLAPGDTTISLTSAAGWRNDQTGGNEHFHSIRLYPYKNSFGAAYPNYEYSRNVKGSAWAAGGISGNTITLKAPWDVPNPNGNGGVWPAGTPVMNSHYGGTYNYLVGVEDTPVADWGTRRGYIAGSQDSPDTGGTSKFRWGTAFIKLVFLFGVGQTSVANSTWINAVNLETDTLNVNTGVQLVADQTITGELTVRRDGTGNQDIPLEVRNDTGPPRVLFHRLNQYWGQMKFDGAFRARTGLDDGYTNLYAAGLYDNNNRVWSDTVAPNRLKAASPTVADFNDAVESGFYTAASAVANAPMAASWWFIQVITYTNSMNLQQTAQRMGTDEVFQRYRNDTGVWGLWKRVRWTEVEQDARYMQLANTQTVTGIKMFTGGGTTTSGLRVESSAGSARAVAFAVGVNYAGVQFRNTGTAHYGIRSNGSTLELGPAGSADHPDSWGTPTVTITSAGVLNAVTLQQGGVGVALLTGDQSIGGTKTFTAEKLHHAPTTGNAGFEIGRLGVATTPYIDFHSGATTSDYDVRLIASGGTGSTAGGGTLSILAADVQWNGSQLLRFADRAVANGLATLGADGKILSAQITDKLALQDLTDVGTLVPGNGEVLVWSSGAASWVGAQLTKSSVGLGNVDNTSDANKPISTATQAALDSKAASSHTHSQVMVTDTRQIAAAAGSSTYVPTPNDLTSYTVSALFSQGLPQDSANARWRSALTVKGWSGSYAAWQIIGGAHDSVDEQLYFRSGAGATWGSSRRIWHEGTLPDPIGSANIQLNSTNAIDWNTVTNPGVYFVSALTTNAPAGAYQYGSLIVTRNGNLVTQEYVPHTSGTTGRIVKRSKFNASDWTSWRYQLEASTVGQANGLATLGADGKILSAQITDKLALGDLTDVGTLTPGNGEVLVWSSGSASWVGGQLTKSSVGLGNVDNTSDAAKPVSTAQEAALALKANLTGATFTGVVSIAPAGTAALEMGRVDGTASSPLIDFHSGATATDYDARIMATGGTGTAGGGTLEVTAAQFRWNGSGVLSAADRAVANGLATLGNNSKILSAQVTEVLGINDLTDVNVGTGSIGDQSVLVYSSASSTWVSGQLTKSSVGLGNVDNTSDANKPVSTAQQTAINAREPSITAGTTAQYWRGDKSWQALFDTTAAAALGTAAAGSAVTAARRDHVHPMPTAAQVGAAASSHTHDDRYYTEAESDARFINQIEANGAFKRARGLIRYNHNAGNVNGSIVIQTNLTFGGFMSNVHIQGYNYTGVEQDIDLNVTFYSTGGATPSFSNIEAVNKGSFDFSQVRLMRRTSDNTVVIVLDAPANPTYSWQYPKIAVDAIVAHSTPTDAMLQGWSLAITTDLTAYTAMSTPPLLNLTLPKAGTSSTFLRGDRSWQTLFDTTLPSALGTAASGSATTAAKRDHVHAMPTPAQVGAEPAFAAGTTAQYYRGDKSWQALFDATLPAALGTAAVGSAAVAARRDHVHPMPTAAQVGAAASSHTHVPGDVTGLFDNINPAALGVAAPGTAAVAARRDHVHPLQTHLSYDAANATVRTYPADYYNTVTKWAYKTTATMNLQAGSTIDDGSTYCYVEGFQASGTSSHKVWQRAYTDLGNVYTRTASSGSSMWDQWSLERSANTIPMQYLPDITAWTAGAVAFAASTEGAMKILEPGSPGDVLFSNGSGAEPEWGPIPAPQVSVLHRAKYIRSATLSIANNTETTLVPDVEDYDPNGIHSNGVFTVTKASHYRVTAGIIWAGNTTGRRVAKFVIGGVERPGQTITPNYSVTAHQSLAWEGYLAAGTTVRIDVLQTSGGALNINEAFCAISEF